MGSAEQKIFIFKTGWNCHMNLYSYIPVTNCRGGGCIKISTESSLAVSMNQGH